MSSSKRASTLALGPKPPVSFASSLVIAENASLTGTNLITVGSSTIIHPRTRLNSTYAPITIGSQCIISERSAIGYQSATENEGEGVVIDNGVVIEVGASVEAKRVGTGCVIEINAKVGKGAVLGKHCKIGPSCQVADGEILPDFTVVYGDGLQRVDNSGVQELKLKMVGRQVDVLRKLIPSNAPKFQ